MRRVDGWTCDELPVADGGEGTAEVLARTLGGEWRESPASDPLGRPVTARWLSLPDGRRWSSRRRRSGSGCSRRRSATRSSPRRAGLGELLVAVLVTGPAAVLVCVGGTATVDGGAGLRRSLPRWPERVPLRVLCDVRNPLLGPRGAARVFGPQKGAGPEAVDELERRLAAMEELAPYRDLPGAGAGGGLGAALACARRRAEGGRRGRARS